MYQVEDEIGLNRCSSSRMIEMRNRQGENHTPLNDHCVEMTEIALNTNTTSSRAALERIGLLTNAHNGDSQPGQQLWLKI